MLIKAICLWNRKLLLLCSDINGSFWRCCFVSVLYWIQLSVGDQTTEEQWCVSVKPGNSSLCAHWSLCVHRWEEQHQINAQTIRYTMYDQTGAVRKINGPHQKYDNIKEEISSRTPLTTEMVKFDTCSTAHHHICYSELSSWMNKRWKSIN